MTTNVVTLGKQGPPGPLAISAATPAILAATPVATTVAGSLAYVASLDAYFRYLPLSSATPDNVGVISAPMGRWVRWPTGPTWTKIVPGIAASTASANAILAGSEFVRAMVNITTPYSPGTTLSLGQTGTPGLIKSGIVMTSAGLQDLPVLGPWGAVPLPILATLAGSPAVGASEILVQTILPQS